MVSKKYNEQMGNYLAKLAKSQTDTSAAVKPQTNADRIRAMSDEQFADWLSIYCCRNKTYDAHCETFGSCKACWLDWLNEEVTE